MRWGPLFGSTIILLCMIFSQWPKIKNNQKKEKAAFMALTIFGWLLINFLFIYPDMPSPTKLIDFMYKPLGKLIE